MRGLYGAELDEEGAYAIGRAYVEQFEPRTVAVGRDMRISAPSMTAAVMEGAADGGADVLDLGMVGTEMVYYAVGELGLEGGICVTASHNPKQYTGMKIVRRGALPVGGDSGLDDVRVRAPRPVSARSTRRGEIADAGRLAGIRRQGALVRRRRRDRAAARRRRRRERHGRRDAAAGARAPAAARRRPLLLRSRRHVPEPRAEPAATREPRVHRREDARGGRRPRRRVRRRRRPLLLRRRHRRVRPGRLRDGAARRDRSWRKNPGGTVLYDVRASWAVPRTIEARRRHRARQPRRPRVHQAPDAEGARASSPARCRRTTTSATSPRPTRASFRSCSCSS